MVLRSVSPLAPLEISQARLLPSLTTSCEKLQPHSSTAPHILDLAQSARAGRNNLGHIKLCSFPGRNHDVTGQSWGTELDTGAKRPRQHPWAAAGGERPLGRQRCRRSPLYGHFEREFVTIKLKRSVQARAGGGRGVGQGVGRTDSQPEPELRLSAPNFSIPDALLSSGTRRLSTLGSGSRRLRRAGGSSHHGRGQARVEMRDVGRTGQAR